MLASRCSPGLAIMMGSILLLSCCHRSPRWVHVAHWRLRTCSGECRRPLERQDLMLPTRAKPRRHFLSRRSLAVPGRCSRLRSSPSESLRPYPCLIVLAGSGGSAPAAATYPLVEKPIALAFHLKPRSCQPHGGALLALAELVMLEHLARPDPRVPPSRPGRGDLRIPATSLRQGALSRGNLL